MMRSELIYEFQLLQESRANKFTELLTEQLVSSMDAVNEKIISSMSQRGRMLLLLDRKINFSRLKNLRKRYLRF